MERYGTDLWNFLKGKTTQSLGLPERVELAKKFSEKFEKIKNSRLVHRDLKPHNVLLNVTRDGKWNKEMEITDFGIGSNINQNGEKAGTS